MDTTDNFRSPSIKAEPRWGREDAMDRPLGNDSYRSRRSPGKPLKELCSYTYQWCPLQPILIYSLHGLTSLPSELREEYPLKRAIRPLAPDEITLKRTSCLFLLHYLLYH